MAKQAEQSKWSTDKIALRKILFVRVTYFLSIFLAVILKIAIAEHKSECVWVNQAILCLRAQKSKKSQFKLSGYNSDACVA